jgi:hypothetical protein
MAYSQLQYILFPNDLVILVPELLCELPTTIKILGRHKINCYLDAVCQIAHLCESTVLVIIN